MSNTTKLAAPIGSGCDDDKEEEEEEEEMMIIIIIGWEVNPLRGKRTFILAG